METLDDILKGKLLNYMKNSFGELVLNNAIAWDLDISSISATDSLRAYELLYDIEEYFNVNIREEDLPNDLSYSDLLYKPLSQVYSIIKPFLLDSPEIKMRVRKDVTGIICDELGLERDEAIVSPIDFGINGSSIIDRIEKSLNNYLGISSKESKFYFPNNSQSIFIDLFNASKDYVISVASNRSS